MIKLARKIENEGVEIAKIKCDIKFLLYCKKNNLAPIFTSPKFAISRGVVTDNGLGRKGWGWGQVKIGTFFVS